MEVDPAEFEKMLPAEQVFEEMLPYLETLDAQIDGVIRLLKDKGITTNEELAKYTQRGDDAANVRERGMRARMEYLFSSAANKPASKPRSNP
jgi:hypothetical protein